MHEGPPENSDKDGKKTGDVISFARFKEKRRAREQELADLEKKTGKKMGETRGKEKGKFSSLEDIALAISEYQLEFLVKLNFLVPMSKTTLNNSGERAFLEEAADIFDEIYRWEKKLKKAYVDLQKIPDEEGLSATVKKYLDTFEIFHTKLEDAKEDEQYANKLLKKMEDFVEQNNKP